MSLDQTIAGLPVLRLLATGERSRVWLVPGDRVLKVLSAGDHAAEVVALERAAGEHAVELLDIAVDDEAAALVFPRLPRGSLAQVLAARTGLDAGEAVTVLAPLTACLARMHAAGVAHRAVGPHNVLFRTDGAPMLIGFGHATVFDPGLPEIALERVDGVIDDRRALAALARAVLTRVTGPRAAAAGEVAQALSDDDLGDLEARLTHELFALAAGRPVRLDPDTAAPSEERRVVGVIEVEPVEDAGAARSYAAVIERLLETGPGRLMRDRGIELWSGWSQRRRRVSVGVAVGVLIVVLAVAVIPVAPPDPIAAVPSPASTLGTSGPSTLPTEVTGDDPLEALPALLDRRAQCFRDLSQLCLDDVDESGSSAWNDDQATLQKLVAQGVQPVLLTAVGATVVERLGDSVIVALAPDTEPASLLLLKGEAGWRIRDYVAKAP